MPKKTKRKYRRKTTRWLTAVLWFAFVVVLGVGAWRAYRYYYSRHHTEIQASPSTTVVVNAKYHFPDLNATHMKAAKKNGVKPFATRKDIYTKGLVKIESCQAYKVDYLSHSVAYLVPKAKVLLQDIAEGFQKELEDGGFRKHRIIVTSVLRTQEDVDKLRRGNPNAVKNSAHQYATTFDITYIRFDIQSVWGKPVSSNDMANMLGKVLNRLRKDGRCYVKYEEKQHCFHITLRY